MADETRIFSVEIITPDRVFYTGEATMIEFNTAAGELGVYRRHIPLTSRQVSSRFTRTVRRMFWRQFIPVLQKFCLKR